MTALPQQNQSRKQPCPSCGGVGCVETYSNDSVPHEFCFRCSDWRALDQQQQPDSNSVTAAQRVLDIETEKKRQHEQAARLAAKIWGKAQPASENHPYLVNKGVKVLEGIRQQGDELLVPLQDMDGKLYNIQRILPNGDKFFLKGSRKQGLFFVLGKLDSQIVCFAEGFATAATIFEATEYTTVVCFDAGNMIEVAQIFHAKYPDKKKIFCADNDFLDNQGQLRPPEKNIGVVKATHAAQLVGGLLVVPEFSPETYAYRPNDFNDMSKIISLNAVREKIHAAALPQQQQEAVWLLSDYGNALILLEHLVDDLAYTPGLGWLGYNSATGIWDPEPGTERIRKKALEKLREIWKKRWQHTQDQIIHIAQQLKNLEEDDDTKRRHLSNQIKKLQIWAKEIDHWITQCESAHRVRSTLEVAEGYLWTDPKVWDANKEILVCTNGVLNLATGQLMPHSPLFKATKSAGTAYDKAATHPAWTAMIQLLQAEGDRYELVHQYCGSGIYGANPTEKVAIFQGTGGSGKSTLLTAVHSALGDYCTTIEINSLLQTDWRKQNKSAPREDLLKLRGARLVYPSIEPPKNAKLDDGSIKALSGNDQISARLPYAKQSVSFLPTFKLIIPTNYPLHTSFDDSGMKRRVVVCPFNHKPEVADPSVKEALMYDPLAKSAVLAWLFEGFQAWREAHYQLPTSEYAKQATNQYWSDMDPYTDFAKENLVFAKHAQTTKKDMSEAFKVWRDESGRRDSNLRDFAKWLISKGVIDSRDTDKARTRLWIGVGLLTDITDITDNTLREKRCTNFDMK